MYHTTVDLTEAGKITTYFLNKDLDMRKRACVECPNPECVYTEGSFTLPKAMTICFRSQALMDMTSMSVRPWSSVMSFGTLLPDWTDLDEERWLELWRGKS